MALIRALGGGGGGQLISKSVTIYSAVGDTVTFTDASGTKTVTIPSGQDHVTATIYALSTGSIVSFQSSVGKNADNTNFTKDIIVSQSTNSVYVMPDNALYWYGYKSPNLEDITSANGWVGGAFTAGPSPTYNTTYITIAPASDHWVGVGSKITVGANKKACAIVQGVSGNNGMGSIAIAASKNYSEATKQYASISTTSLQKSETSILTVDGYVHASVVSGSSNLRSFKLYGLWYE